MKCGDWDLIRLKKEKRVVENNCLVDGIAVENNCNICHSKLNFKKLNIIEICMCFVRC